MTQPVQSPLQGMALSATAFLILSCADATIKGMNGAYSVYQMLFYTTLFALVPMTIFMIWDREQTNFRPRRPWLLAARTVLMIVSFLCVYYTFVHIPLAEAYAIFFAAPMFITILSVPLLGEQVGLQRWMAVLVGLIGVIVVLRPGFTVLETGHYTAMFASVLFAFSAIIVRKIGSQERSASMILVPYLCLFFVMAALMPSSYIPVALGDLGLMALIGLLTVGGQLCSIFAARVAPAAVIASMHYSQIIWAVLFGAFVFNETPDFWVGVGIVIIISSGLFVVYRETRVSRVNPVTSTASQRIDTLIPVDQSNTSAPTRATYQ